jgi:hypothetical protein
MSSAKQAARELIEPLPESVSWNDLMHELYVKQKIEEGSGNSMRAAVSPMRRSSAAS